MALFKNIYTSHYEIHDWEMHDPHYFYNFSKPVYNLFIYLFIIVLKKY